MTPERSVGEPVGDQRVPEPVRVDLAGQVRDALAHLYDPAYLQTHPLTHLLHDEPEGRSPLPAVTGTRVAPPEESSRRRPVLGRRLRQALLEAVEALHPDADSAGQARHSRILQMRYVEGLAAREIQEQLAISRAQFYREHQTALEAVVSIVRQRWKIGDAARRMPSCRSLDGPEIAQDHRLAVEPVRPLHNLPSTLTSFVGRESERAEVSRLLKTTRLLTLTGTGGAGKTRLALRAAADLVHDYSDGVWLVELAALAEPELLVRTVAFRLGLPEQSGITIDRALLDFLRSRRLLLVLDNCEHLIEACARFVNAALQACPNVQVITTSREPLGVYGELAWRVPSLAVPVAREEISLERLGDYESVRLLVERARLVQPDFQLTESNAEAVSQVCRRLDGIPLAIELAAARLSVLSIEQIASRLSDRFRLLTGGSRTALRRQQTLWATVEWSHRLLSEAEQTVLRRLAVFSGGWTLEAAESVCLGEGIESDAVLDLLAGLVRKSLVVADVEIGAPRYRLLETMRQYASQKLVDADEAETTRNRHRDWYLGLARRAEPELQRADSLSWLDRLEVEHDNLRTVLAWCLESDVQAGLELAGCLFLFWDYHCHFQEGRRWSLELLEMAPEPNLNRARAMRTAGAMSRAEGDLKLARQLLKESLRLCQQLGNQREAGRTALQLGTTSRDADEVDALYAVAFSAAREAGDDIMASEALQYLSSVARHRGEYDRSWRLLEESLALARAAGSGHRVAWNILGLGSLALEEGDWSRARVLFEECLTHFRDERHGYGISQTQLSLGHIDASEGDLSSANDRLVESLSVARRMGTRSLIVNGLLLAGVIAVGSRSFDRAARLFGAIDAERKSSLIAYRQFQEDADRAAVAVARSALGEEAFARSWAAGQATSMDEAIELALRPLADEQP